MTGFVASRDKLEAVNRLSSLTHSGPEELGPGSKERKRVLVNVVTFLGLPIDVRLSKPRLGQAIVEALGGTWGPECFSRGDTITLVGLDRVLRHATTAAGGGVLPPPADLSVADEAQRILATCASEFAGTLDVRTCVTTMLNRGDPNWAQSEWPGWYFETTARAHCMAMLGGVPGPLYGHSAFDFQLARVWDFKAHSEHQASGRRNTMLLLNDSRAIRSCVAEHGGLGFIVAHGNSTYDADGSVRQWMTSLRLAQGKTPKGAPSDRPRAFKATFEMNSFEALFLPDQDTIEAGLREGWLKPFQEGFREPDGSPRAPKYQIHGVKRPAALQVALHPVDA